MGVKLIGTGRFAPEQVFTVQEMSEILQNDISPFMQALGIGQRHQTRDDESSTTLAIEAGKRALADAGISAEEIDLLILSTDTPDIISPPTASSVAFGLGLRDGAPFFDMNVSCTGFIMASEAANNFIKGNPVWKTVMVISVYNMTKFSPMEKGKFFCIFSDGAGAAVYQRGEGEGFIDSVFIGNGSQWESLGIYVGGTRYPASVDLLEGRGDVKPGLTFWKGELMNRNPELWPVIIHQLLEKTGYTLEDVDRFIFTQINRSAVVQTCQNLGIGIEKTHNIMDRYGYTGNACIIMALDDALESGTVKQGDLVCLTASGVGFTMGTMLIRV